MTFDQAVQLVLKSEGGYVNDPDDPGGETKYGITIAVARQYGYTGKMQDLPVSTAIAIYKKKYWDANQIEKYPDHLQYALFDSFVNMGYNTIGLLSIAAGLPWKNQYTKTADGTNNSNIIAWDDAGMQKVAQGVSLGRFLTARRQYYVDLVRRRPASEKYLRGWLNRIEQVRESALKFIKENPGLSIAALILPAGMIFFLIKAIWDKKR